MRLRRRDLVLALTAATAAVVPFVPAASAGGGNVVLSVLSSRADLVSAGDALVAVSLPAGARGLHVRAGSRDVTRAFAKRADGQVRGLVTGLPLGRTTLTATVAGGRGARITLVDHPIGGPVFSGPQITPWACAAGTTGPQCNAKPTYTYKYLPRGAEGTPGQAVGNQSPLQDYDPASPPPAPFIATTTTQTGATVPFIVRTETGYMDRDQYSISALFQPGRKWDGTTPQPQFNHKLVLTHGASCDTEYQSGSAPDTLNVAALGAGFVVASHALDNAGHNCNLAVQAEALYMTKERVIGCAYDDIKKVLAYSTVSQIGYMFLAVGIPGAGAFAILHLLTHGFFKACMFLSAGSVMHASRRSARPALAGLLHRLDHVP